MGATMLKMAEEAADQAKPAESPVPEVTGAVDSFRAVGVVQQHTHGRPSSLQQKCSFGCVF